MKIDQSTIDRFLEPKMLRSLGRLSLMSRRVVEGAQVGSHRSPFKGFSTEFADHRQYVKGDDLRHLDWKVFSRTERYYIKQYEENTNLRGHIILDCSASMNFPKKPGPGKMTKYEYACRLAAGLAYVLIRQQDPVGLVMFNEQVVTQLPAMRSMTHLRRILRTFDDIAPSSQTDSGKALTAVAGLLKRRGLLIIISDLLDEPQRITDSLAMFRHRGHDAIVIQVLDHDELNFPFRKRMTFRDMETRENISLDGAEVAADYTHAINEFIAGFKKSCFEHNFDYMLADTATPYDALLAAMLARRQR
ncbi:DUF58 domain-containing protein [Planctomycetales bacterium ZRK34]|nr:DUF58 domain-containing protein [Planctomycetales bacterium ZRK34]